MSTQQRMLSLPSFAVKSIQHPRFVSVVFMFGRYALTNDAQSCFIIHHTETVPMHQAVDIVVLVSDINVVSTKLMIAHQQHLGLNVRPKSIAQRLGYVLIGVTVCWRWLACTVRESMILLVCGRSHASCDRTIFPRASRTRKGGDALDPQVCEAMGCIWCASAWRRLARTGQHLPLFDPAIMSRDEALVHPRLTSKPCCRGSETYRRAWPGRRAAGQLARAASCPITHHVLGVGRFPLILRIVV